MAPAEAVGWTIAAILCGAYLGGFHQGWLWFTAGAILLGFFAILHSAKYWLIAILLPATFAGGLYYRIYFAEQMASRILPQAGRKFTAEIVTAPKLADGQYSFAAELKPPLSGKLQISAPAESVLRYGYELELGGKLYPPENERELPGFRADYLNVRKISGGSPLIRFLYTVRERSLSGIERNLHGKEGAFLEGLLLGYKNDFPPSLREDMKRSGTTHLVALSGYNVSILVLAIHGLLLGLISRRTLFYLICGMVIVFSILTGAESSIVRAAIMGILVLSARELRRMPGFGLVFLWTALLMYLWNPGVLFEIGFMLSFASLLGISYIPGALRNFFRLKEGRFTDYFLLTFGAQLSTLPIIALVFEKISWLSLLANLIILPVVPMLMGFGFIFLAVSVFAPLLSWFLGAMLKAALGIVLWVMHAIGGLAPQLSLNGISAALWAMYACGLILLIWKYGRKNAR